MDLQRTLTAAEARSAIYLDFEGTAKDPPTFVGFVYEDRPHEVVVLEDTFAAVAAAKDLRCTSIAEICEELASLAERESRVLVSWSTYDLEVLTAAIGRSLERLESRNLLRDGKATAKRWSRACLDDPLDAPHELWRYLVAAEIPVPPHLGYRQTAHRIRDVRSQLLLHERFDELTPVAKGKWTKVVDHNRHDCVDLRTLIVRAASELMERSRSPA